MTESEIKQLIKNNHTDKLNVFLSEIFNKSKNLDKRINLTSIGMLVLILIYYLGELDIKGEIQLGPLKISDTKPLLYVLPLIFSFLILRFVILSSHKAEIKNLVRIFASDYFAFSDSKDDILFTDDFTRLVLPFSIYDEIGKFNFKTKVGCLSVLLTLPMILMAFAPYFFASVWIYPRILEFSSLELYNKVLVGSTVWILVLSVFYIFKTILLGFKENK
ncbi:MAG: hypothetical protein ACFB15_21655 [Cyclobacteriaceae bacterium]